MTKEAKHCINALERNIQMGFPLVGDMVEASYARTIINLIESLSAQLDQVTRERDAAVEDVKSLCATNDFRGNFCHYCKYNEPDGQCHHHCIPYSSEWGWEWRGVEVEG